jgi:hypothetical protein
MPIRGSPPIRIARLLLLVTLVAALFLALAGLHHSSVPIGAAAEVAVVIVIGVAVLVSELDVRSPYMMRRRRSARSAGVTIPVGRSNGAFWRRERPVFLTG